MTKADIRERAARGVVRSADHEGSFYEAQTPVEDWALDALDAALSGNSERLLDLYENAKWEQRVRPLRPVGRGMPDDCPRCQRPLTEDGHLRYCARCAYEPPESANLPVIAPTEDDGELTNRDCQPVAEPVVGASRGSG